MAKNPDERFQSAADALAFFQKGRADEIMSTAKNINIDNEIGFTLGKEDMKESPRNNAMATQNSEMSLPKISDLNNTKTIPHQEQHETPLEKSEIQLAPLSASPKKPKNKTDNYISERKNELRKMASITNSFVDPSGFFSLNKNKFLIKAFLNTIVATIILVTGVICFLKLGTICSNSITEDAGLWAYFIQPWHSSSAGMPSGQMFWGLICICYIAVLIFITKMELLKELK